MKTPSDAAAKSDTASIRSRDQGPYLLFTLLLSLVALVLLAVQVVFKPDPSTGAILNGADNVICGLFFLDFLYQLFTAPSKWRYFVTWGWLDLLACIPNIDALRSARAVRIVRILRVLRGVKAARVLARAIVRRRSESTILAATLLSVLLVTVGAIGVLHFEREEGNIKTPEDAVWWAMATVTTVGYGDRYPVTTEGRMVAVMLMIGGVGMFGILSGFIAAWFLAPERDRAEAQMTALREEVARMSALLRAPGASGNPPEH